MPDRPGIAALIVGSLADAAINVDMIVQNVSEDGTTTDMTFTVGRSELERAVEVLTGMRDELAFRELRSDANVAKVSVVGLGMRTSPVSPKPCSKPWPSGASIFR